VISVPSTVATFLPPPRENLSKPLNKKLAVMIKKIKVRIK
jgi:hypothetical protein